MIVGKSFATVPGAFFFSTPEITNVRILGVKREGVGLTEVSASPGSREFVYNNLFIRVSLTNRFITGEKIWILYEA